MILYAVWENEYLSFSVHPSHQSCTGVVSIFGSMPGRALAEPYTACKQASMVATHVLIAAQDTKDANMHGESKKVHVFRKHSFSSSAVKIQIIA